MANVPGTQASIEEPDPHEEPREPRADSRPRVPLGQLLRTGWEESRLPQKKECRGELSWAASCAKFGGECSDWD